MKYFAYTIKDDAKRYLGTNNDKHFISGSADEVKSLFCEYAKYELDLDISEDDITLELIPKEKFYISADEYIAATGDKNPCKYRCNECGCTFFGKYHSSYSIEDVECPICLDETDPLFIEYV